MHYWWTRKPLIVAKAVILGALLPADFDKKEFKELLGLGRKKRAHAYGVDLNALRMYYEKMWGTESPTVLDPFGGGGSIPFEAMHLGVNVYCVDYNPIAYIILKTALKYPQKYGEQLIEDVKFWTDWIIDKTKNELKGLYPEHDGKKVSAKPSTQILDFLLQFCQYFLPMEGDRAQVKQNYISNGDNS